MDVRNCRKCSKIFNYIGGPQICPNCVKEQEDRFQAVKDYIKEHPNAPINEIADQCDVTSNQIRKWVREERLVFGDDSLIGIECEGCGVTIKSGRYCDKCKYNLIHGIMKANEGKQERNTDNDDKRSGGPKMRFLE